MDLSTGVLLSSVGRSDSFLHTDILYNTHSDIPPPSHAGQVFSTTSNIWPTCQLPTSTSHPVPESNRYSILPVEDTNKLSLDDRVVGAPPKPTKRPTSSSLRVNVADKKATTISPVLVTAKPQSRPSSKRFQAAVMKARLEDAEPHVHSLQSSVAEGHTNSGKVGPQA